MRFVALALLAPVLSVASANQPPELTPEIKSYLSELGPEPSYLHVLTDLYRTVSQRHYVRKDIDLTFSQQTYKDFIERLDSQNTLFLQQDLDRLSRFKKDIYAAIKGRDLQTPYMIYRLREQRAAQAILYQIELLEDDSFDFSFQEYLNTDREEADAFLSWEEWRDYWRRALKNQLLISFVDGTEVEEAKQRLKRRLQNGIKSILRKDAEDGLASFANASLAQYDPHTSFLPPQEYQDWILSLQTQLEGIGAVLQFRDDYIEIVRLIEGGPAQRSGRIHPGDRITGVISNVGDELIDTVGMSLTEVVRLIRGKKGSQVSLEILPNNMPSGANADMLHLVRAVIPLEHQRSSYEIREIEKYQRFWRIGIVSVPGFYGNVPGSSDLNGVSEDIRANLRNLKAQGVDAVMLDMSNNGGGYLHEAMSVAGLFLPPGPFVQIRNQGNRLTPSGKKRTRPEWSKPMAVLVNRLSASASEIVAAAIQDYKRGLIIGTPTFGKGTVQTAREIGDDQGQLKLTISKYYRVNGGTTQGKGVIPDILLPAIYNPEQVGEAVYENALAFDTVKALRISHQPAMQADIGLLQSMHNSRQVKKYGLQYLKERRYILDELSEQQTVPLALQERKNFQANVELRQLELENRVRRVQQKEVFQDWDEYLEWRRSQFADPDYKPLSTQILQSEAAEVMVDYLYQQWRSQLGG